MNEWSYNFTPPIYLHVVDVNNFDCTVYLTFNNSADDLYWRKSRAGMHHQTVEPSSPKVGVTKLLAEILVLSASQLS